MIPHSITDTNLSLLVDGRMRVIPRTSPNFIKLRDELRKDNPSAKRLKELLDIPSFIAKHTFGRVQIGEKDVLFDGQEVPAYAAQRILKHIQDGDSIKPLAELLGKIMVNPNKDIRTDLWKWIEAGSLPICEDGDIVAFKKVLSNYHSIHGTGPDGKPFVHTKGSVLSMSRELCDENRTECSRGLHFCSWPYLKHFGGSGPGYRIVIVKVNPTNITAIPPDYDMQKGRTCTYEVIDEVPEEDAREFFGVGTNVTRAGVPDNYKGVGDEGDWTDEIDGLESEVDEEEIPGNGEEAEIEVPYEEPQTAPEDGEIDPELTVANGNTYKLSQLLSLVKEHSQRGVAALLTIPRSTLGDFLRLHKKED